MERGYACLVGLVACGTVSLAYAAHSQEPTSGIGQAPDHQTSKSWLDKAVVEKHCPLTPVNVPPGIRRNSAGPRMSMVQGTLQIEGTSDPEHIVLEGGGAPDVVRVVFDGVPVGTFARVGNIRVQGGGGDDVIIVKDEVGVPVRLETGSGDDCLQSGSGGDQLLGLGGNDVFVVGTGRPALKTGTGSSRIVRRWQRMGVLRITESAQGELLPLLSQTYVLQTLSTQNPGQSSADLPIVAASADLEVGGRLRTRVQQRDRLAGCIGSL